MTVIKVGPDNKHFPRKFSINSNKLNSNVRILFYI